MTYLLQIFSLPIENVVLTLIPSIIIDAKAIQVLLTIQYPSEMALSKNERMSKGV